MRPSPRVTRRVTPRVTPRVKPRVTPRVTLRAATLALLLVALTACSKSATPVAAPTPVSYHGVIPSVENPRPEFVLTTTAGKAYDFEAMTKGKATLLYFGYTHCPDECPTALHDLAAALKQVPPAIRDAVTVIFVTTDPPRDTPAVLSAYLARFDATFIGLTGTTLQIQSAERAVGVPLAQAETTGKNSYAVSHSAVVIAYSTSDRNPVLYPGGTQVDDIAADLPLLVKEKSTT